MHSMSTSADASKSYIRGWIARAYQDSHGRNTQMDELRHMAIRLLHVRSFPTIPGSKESANNWARTTLLCCKSLVYGVENVSLKMYQLRLRELGVKNAHPQFPHTRANRNFSPVPVQAPYVWCPSRSIVYGVGVREWCERSKPTF